MAKTFDLSVIFKVIDKATRPIRKIGNSLKMMILIPLGCISETWITFKNIDCEIKEGDVILWKN